MTKTIKTIAVINTILLGSLLATQANAASACKGLENSACTSTAQCGWVEGYQRKDGREVKSFCRTKAKRSVAKVTSNASDALLDKVAKSN